MKFDIRTEDGKDIVQRVSEDDPHLVTPGRYFGPPARNLLVDEFTFKELRLQIYMIVRVE